MNQPRFIFLKHTQNFIKQQKLLIRAFSSNHDSIERQNRLFDLEKKRKKENVGRIEKIQVNYTGVPKPSTLIMNKDISTPYDCAQHINETVMKRSVVAVINENTLWHMHRPLPQSCDLNFLHYTVQQPSNVNKIFWRTCSFMLGAMVARTFKENVQVQLHSFPSPNVRSGSFVYDVELSLENWTPTQDELRVLSIEMIKLNHKNTPFEYLDVSADLALEMFKDNPHKSAQIPNIALHNENKVTLYRAGDHIDISKGPMISNTEQIGRCTITAVHKLNIKTDNGQLYRFQGVALPKVIQLNHFAYSIIENAGKKMNSARLPGQDNTMSDIPVAVN